MVRKTESFTYERSNCKKKVTINEDLAKANDNDQLDVSLTVKSAYECKQDCEFPCQQKEIEGYQRSKMCLPDGLFYLHDNNYVTFRT